MAKKNNQEEEITYHVKSEDIFRNRMPLIAGLVNKLKPYVLGLGINDICFTSLGLKLFNNDFSEIDILFTQQAKEKSSGIEFVEKQILIELNEKRRILKDLVHEINREIDNIPSKVQSLHFQTLDSNECLKPEYLSIDKENDIFILDEHAVERVKGRFQIKLEGDGLAMYHELKQVAKLFESIKGRGNLAGFHYSFNPGDLIIDEDPDNARFEVDIYKLWEDLNFLGNRF